MEISSLQERITIQKQTVEVDDIGNHKNTWSDYYSCFASPSTYLTGESGGVVPYDNQTVTFTIRSCAKTKVLTSTNYRVKFNDLIYNIDAVDPMNYDNKSIKIRCKKVVNE